MKLKHGKREVKIKNTLDITNTKIKSNHSTRTQVITMLDVANRPASFGPRKRVGSELGLAGNY